MGEADEAGRSFTMLVNGPQTLKNPMSQQSAEHHTKAAELRFLEFRAHDL